MPQPMTVKERFYPETAAGGFSRVDGTIEFYTRVNALLEPGMTVLDFGAGRGAAADDAVAYRRQLRRLKGKVRRVIGVDVDPVVLQNPNLDEARVIRPDQPLPLPDAAVDMIVANWVFEHLEQPRFAARELARVLRPGGWICARTPNRWSYAALGARLTPQTLHNRVLHRLQPRRKTADVFPTVYRLNTRRAIREHFPSSSWKNCVYVHNPEPAYFVESTIAWWVMLSIFKVLPEFLGTTLMVFLQRRQRGSEGDAGAMGSTMPAGSERGR
jgi:SAM-dependent methyltransferase